MLGKCVALRSMQKAFTSDCAVSAEPRVHRQHALHAPCSLHVSRFPHISLYSLPMALVVSRWVIMSGEGSSMQSQSSPGKAAIFPAFRASAGLSSSVHVDTNCDCCCFVQTGTAYSCVDTCRRPSSRGERIAKYSGHVKVMSYLYPLDSFGTGMAISATCLSNC
jgi:hypothetical protein